MLSVYARLSILHTPYLYTSTLQMFLSFFIQKEEPIKNGKAEENKEATTNGNNEEDDDDDDLDIDDI